VSSILRHVFNDHHLSCINVKEREIGRKGEINGDGKDKYKGLERNVEEVRE
jgi:hypothetical protein